MVQKVAAYKPFMVEYYMSKFACPQILAAMLQNATVTIAHFGKESQVRIDWPRKRQ